MKKRNATLPGISKKVAIRDEELATLVGRHFRKEEKRADAVDDLPHRHLEAALKELVAVANYSQLLFNWNRAITTLFDYSQP